MSRRSSLVALPLLLLALDAPAQAPKHSTELQWAHDYDAALKTAAAEKKPILFVIMKDNEIACKRMLESVYTDEGVKARLGSFVLLPCSTYDHTDGASQNCTQFKGVTCAEHQAIERAMRQRFQDENLVVAPQHLVCDSSGKLLLRKLYELKPAGLIEFLDRGFGLFLEGAGGVASQPASKAAESKPAGGAPAADANAPKKLSPDLEAKVVSIVKGDDAAKESLTKELMTDSTPERRDAFLEVVARLKMNKDKEIVIRAIGYPEFASAAPAVITLLADKDALVRNCAVVTLEEMANPSACDPLVQLIKKEKEPEIHKDVVRALGPCGGAKPEARAILLKELGSSQENVRSGAALSLGYFLAGDADVEKALRSRWEKDGSNLRIKTAILWGIALSGDQAQVKLVDDLTKDDNNGQIKQLAAGVKTRLNGGDPFAGGGGGGGPPKGGGRFGGGRFGILKLLAPLYADDKIVRNRIKEFRNFRGG
jgi:HEAT repeat protein